MSQIRIGMYPKRHVALPGNIHSTTEAEKFPGLKWNHPPV